MLFRIHVFEGPGFSGFMFFMDQVFVGPGFSGSASRVQIQVLELAVSGLLYFVK